MGIREWMFGRKNVKATHHLGTDTPRQAEDVKRRQAENLKKIKEGVVIGQSDGRLFVFIRQDIVDDMLNDVRNKFGGKLPDAERDWLAIFAETLIKNSGSSKTAMRYATGKDLVQRVRSGQEIIDGSDVPDAPGYLVLL